VADVRYFHVADVRCFMCFVTPLYYGESVESVKPCMLVHYIVLLYSITELLSL